MVCMDTSTAVISHTFDWSCTSPSSAVIAAIAILENVGPMRLDTVLYEYIDPGALDTLVVDDGSVSLSFPCGDYRVDIDENVLVVRAD